MAQSNKMPASFIKTWLTAQRPEGSPPNITILTERANQRALVKDALRTTILDHFVGAEIIELIGGYPKAANVNRNALPMSKRTRSGDFGEILATEYVDQSTGYAVPIRRLRYKDDRSVSMRGDDVLGFEFENRPTRILKIEAKSRLRLTPNVLEQADDGLRRHQGRPNPSTLSFISRRLREAARHELAKIIEQLQESDIPLNSITHLIFTVSANDPTELLKANAGSTFSAIQRELAGCVIDDHSDFIHQLYEAALKGVGADGIS